MFHLVELLPKVSDGHVKVHPSIVYLPIPLHFVELLLDESAQFDPRIGSIKYFERGDLLQNVRPSRFHIAMLSGGVRPLLPGFLILLAGGISRVLLHSNLTIC